MEKWDSTIMILSIYKFFKKNKNISTLYFYQNHLIINHFLQR